MAINSNQETGSMVVLITIVNFKIPAARGAVTDSLK